MKIHKIEYDNGDSYCNESSELSEEYDIKNYISPLEPDEMWYWYNTEPYAGNGNLILRKGNKYLHHNMSHCSCYGPCEGVASNEWQFLEELKKEFTTELLKEIQPLLDSINNK